MSVNRCVVAGFCLSLMIVASAAHAQTLWRGGEKTEVDVVAADETDENADAPAYKSQAITATENGVSVTRGSPSPKKKTLMAEGPRVIVKKEKTVVIHRNCFRRRPLVTHGFQGVKRYHKSIGAYPADTFGGDYYSRYGQYYC